MTRIPVTVSSEPAPRMNPPELPAMLANARVSGEFFGYAYDELPVPEPLLLRNHPTKVYFVVHALFRQPSGRVRPVLISAAIVDKAFVN